MTVLLFRTVHDVEHLGPVVNEREHCAPGKEERERNPCSSSSFSSSSSSFHSTTRRSQARGPIQRRHAASSAGVAEPSRTRRLTTSIFSSNFAFRSSFSFASSASFTNLSAASSSSLWRCRRDCARRELHSRDVQGVATTQNRLCLEGHRGSHVTDRGCLLEEWRIQ